MKRYLDEYNSLVLELIKQEYRIFQLERELQELKQEFRTRLNIFKIYGGCHSDEE